MTCDCCNRRSFADGDESEVDLKAHAQDGGWTFRKVPNGAIWDLCPECSQLKTDELP